MQNPGQGSGEPVNAVPGEKAGVTPFRDEVRVLLQMAMAIFVITVVVGMLNGLDLVDFDRPALLTHVHAGTLGWITLSVLAASIWVFSEGQAARGSRALVRSLSYAAILTVAAYVLAFYSGNLTARIVTGSLVFLVVAGFDVWIIGQTRRVRLTVPQLALLGALTSLTIGSVLGVLFGVRLAGNPSIPEGIGAAHPTALVVGYLILVGMAVSEWRLKPVPSLASADRLGVAQVVLPFLGGLTLSIGAMIDNFALITLNVPLEVLGVLIYLLRLGPRIARLRWREGSNGRLFGISALFLVANVALLTYLIVGYVSGKYERIELIPPWLIFALDHAMFIGVMTNGLMGLVWEAARQRRALWPWADHVLFWGMNVGLVGFVVGLIMQEAVLKRIFTPVMGASILLAVLAYAVRLRAPRGEAAV